MTEQLNLLPPVWPPGFEYFSDFISPEEEDFLIQFSKKLPWENYEMKGVVALRKVYHLGINYRPIPDVLQSIISRGAKALNEPSEKIVHVLFTHYPKGAPIGWHRDAPMFGKILGISLGASCTMKLKPYDPKVSPVRKIELARRSAYILSGESRWKWEHHIPAVKEERFSLTMRTFV